MDFFEGAKRRVSAAGGEGNLGEVEAALEGEAEVAVRLEKSADVSEGGAEKGEVTRVEFAIHDGAVAKQKREGAFEDREFGALDIDLDDGNGRCMGREEVDEGVEGDMGLDRGAQGGVACAVGGGRRKGLLAWEPHDGVSVGTAGDGLAREDDFPFGLAQSALANLARRGKTVGGEIFAETVGVRGNRFDGEDAKVGEIAATQGVQQRHGDEPDVGADVDHGGVRKSAAGEEVDVVAFKVSVKCCG